MRVKFQRGFLPQIHPPDRCSSLLFTQLSRDPLLQHLHYHRRIGDVRLADRQMNVLRHDHKSEQAEVIAVADLAENLKERVARFGRPQQRHAPVAAARDEMPVAETISPFQLVSHQESEKPHVSKTETRGTLQ